MTDTTNPSHALSDGAWVPPEHRAHMPDTPMLPGAEISSSAAVDLLNRATREAHATVDRLADGAAPAVQQIGERVPEVEDTLSAKANHLRETRDDWAESMRSTVRNNPLASMIAAVLLGALGVRVIR